MFPRIIRSLVLRSQVPFLLGGACVAEAHVVPNMTLEASFGREGGYTLNINVDPRTFLAADPTTLPPVPGSWYQEQTPAQIAATQESARQYLAKAITLIFDGQPTPLPACEIQAIDGEDNSPLKPDTQEIHLLATAHGSPPSGAVGFQIGFSKEANTTLILLQNRTGSPEMRPQVVFPGETSRPFVFRVVEPKTTAAATESPGGSKAGRIWLGIVVGMTAMLLIQGWRLLKKYRHHHRSHRRPRHDKDVNN